MKTQICFEYNNSKYYSFNGSAFIADKHPNTNAIPHAELVTSNSFSNSFKKVNNGRSWQQTPIVQNAEVKTFGGYFLVRGTITIDSIEYTVELVENGLTVTAVNAESTVVEEPEANAEEPAVETKVEEPVVDKVEEPVVTKVEEPVVKSKVEEPTVDTKTVEPVVEPEVKVDEPVAEVKEEPLPSTPKPVQTVKGFSSPERKVKRGFCCNGEFVSDSTLTLGKTVKKKSGLVIGESSIPQAPRSVRRFENTVDTTEVEEERKAAVEAQRREEEAMKVLQDSWSKLLPVHERYQASFKPTPVEHEPLPQVTVPAEPPTDELRIKEARNKAKEAVRETLTPEINRIIGDIPTDLLGPIQEFTSFEIDKARLEEEGDIYCINKRWCKRGKWFCIDVVPNAARYFYNSRLGVSIEIPVNILKAWNEALSYNG